MPEQVFNDPVVIDSGADETQLTIQGSGAAGSEQTAPLQSWQTSDAVEQARITGDGRLQIGTFSGGAMATDDSLIEAHRSETDTGKPKRGSHLLGAITDPLTSIISWIVQELVLKGTSGITALHTALRVRLTNQNTGSMTGAKLLGGDIEVSNAGGHSSTNGKVPTAAGLRVGLTNQSGGYLQTGVGLQVEMANAGVADTLIGIDIPDVDEGTDNFAIRTGAGKVQFGELGAGLVKSNADGLLTNVAADTDPDVEMVGATDTEDGATGLVPQPLAGDEEKFLRADGQWAIPAGGQAEGGIVPVSATAGVALTARDAAYLNLSDNKLYKIDIDTGPQIGTVRGFVLDTVAANDPATLIIGGVLDGFVGLTAWLPVYVARGTGGDITQIPPYPLLDGSQIAIVPLGMAISATQIAVMQEVMDCRIRYQKRFSPALDEMTTVEHGQNAAGLGRNVLAYVTQDTILTEYASSNQNDSYFLAGPMGDGETKVSSATGSLSPVGDTSGTEYRTAQSFTVSTSGRLTQFKFTLGANGGTPSGDVLWEFRNNNAGVPGSTVLASGRILNANIVPSAQNTVPVYDGPALAAGTYWLVLISETNQASNAKWQWVCQSSVFAGGNRAYSTNGGSSWTTDAFDQAFEVQLQDMPPFNKIAQGFQIASASDVKTVRLWLRKIGAPTGNLTVKIQTNNAGTGNPSGTTVTNGTSSVVLASSLSTSYGWIDFTFSTPPSLNASTQYHLVLETTDTSPNANYVAWGGDATSPSYSDGAMKAGVSGSWTTPVRDACFQIYADALTYTNPINIDWWSSARADMVNRFGDSVGADLDTKTTFKCKASAGFADVTVEVVL